MTNMMRAEDIPAFVEEVLAIGCDMKAFSGDSYFFGDADLPPSIADRIAPDLRRIGERYGPRDHLRAEIAEYLRSIGREYHSEPH